MRTPILVLAGAFLLAGCSSGTRTVYVPVPAPAAEPQPQYEPVEMPPVGITIVRADDRRLLVSTNQPAYVALFEVVPGRGARLVYPASERQRQSEVSGSSWLTVSTRLFRTDDDYLRDVRYDRYERIGVLRRPLTTRYIYALASDRPLRITERSYDDAHLRFLMGDRVWQSEDAYAMMESLAWHFLPAQLDEDWGEDVHVIDLARPAAPIRVARVYCPDGSVVYVRDDLAHRASCPPHTRGRGTGRVSPALPRPDSVVASTGRPIIRKVDPRSRPPVFRVPKPDVAQGGSRPVPLPTPVNPAPAPAVQATTGDGHASGRHSVTPWGNAGREAADKQKEDKEKKDKDKENGDNGNHYGRDTELGRGNNGDSPSMPGRVRQQGRPMRPVVEAVAPVTPAPEQAPSVPEVRPAPEPRENEARPPRALDRIRGRSVEATPAAEPPRAEPPRAEPPRAEPPRAEPPRAEPPRAEPPQRAPEPPAREAKPDDEKPAPAPAAENRGRGRLRPAPADTTDRQGKP